MSIEIKDLTKMYNGFTVLKGITFSVRKGEFVTVLGASGSGKSTLLRVIAGLELPESGNVVVDGKDVTYIKVQERNVGFVFQHYALFRHMTVLDNIAFGLRVQNVSKGLAHFKARNLMALVGLSGLDRRMPSQLSGGQRQRVALARALAPEPKLLLLDEPFAALDARLRKDLREWLRRLHDRVGLTTLLVTHDQEEAFELSDRILLINRGRIEQEGSPKQIFNQPATEHVATFVGETNRVDGHAESGWVKWGPLQFKAPDHIKDQTPVAVFFRPIDVYVSSQPEDGAVPGTIRSSRFFGALEEFKIVLDGNIEVIAQVPKGVAQQSHFENGKNVYVLITFAHIFPRSNIPTKLPH